MVQEWKPSLKCPEILSAFAATFVSQNLPAINTNILCQVNILLTQIIAGLRSSEIVGK